MPEFSVLLPVYAGDRADFFRRAIASVTAEQELRPSELVIVRDGPVDDPIQAVLDEARSGPLTAGVPVRVVELAANEGLARALETGLAACAHEIVARADADDISLPPRFAVQVPLVEAGLDLLSAAIVEFTDDEHDWGLVRAWPSDPAAIAALARFQDPFNHPAVVYRRAAVARAGGYEHLERLEDYWLFVRMIAEGARVSNVGEPLVLYRIGSGAYRRRGGWDLMRSEVELQRRMHALGFTTWAQATRNLVVRGVWRLVPSRLRRRIYRWVTLGRRN